MPTSATTNIIAGYIEMLAATALFSPALSDGSTTYKTINYGSLRDYNDLTPCLEIELHLDGTRRQAIGGRIRDMTDFLIRSTVPYSSASDTAESNIATVRDTITQIFHEHATLGQNPLTTGIQDNRIREGSPRFGYANRNGIWWRCHEFIITVTMEYVIQIVP